MAARYIYVPFPESQPGDFSKSALERWGEQYPQECIVYKPETHTKESKINGPFSFKGRDTRHIQIYIAGHGDRGVSDIANFQREQPQDYHLINAEEIVDDIIKLGLPLDFSGAIKCACCFSANNGSKDTSFAAQIGAFFYFENYERLTVYGYVDEIRRTKQNPIDPEIGQLEAAIATDKSILEYLKKNNTYDQKHSPEEERIAENERRLSNLKNVPDPLKGTHFWCAVQKQLPSDAPYNLRIGEETFLFRRSDRRKRYDPTAERMIDAPRSVNKQPQKPGSSRAHSREGKKDRID